MLSNHHIDVLIAEDRIAARVDELAQEVASALGRTARSEALVVVGPLKGATLLVADLIRALYRAGVATEIDFLGLSSYGASTVSSGTVTLTSDLSMDIAGRHVLLVDDIIDTGRTLRFAQDHLLQRKPASLRTLVLLDKPDRRVVHADVEHVGFVIPDLFVIGYGTDLNQRYRELPFVGVLTQDV